MADAYSLAKQHLEAGIAEAAENNVDLNAYGQALMAPPTASERLSSVSLSCNASIAGAWQRISAMNAFAPLLVTIYEALSPVRCQLIGVIRNPVRMQA